jgi:hypothetical protein
VESDARGLAESRLKAVPPALLTVNMGKMIPGKPFMNVEATPYLADYKQLNGRPEGPLLADRHMI